MERAPRDKGNGEQAAARCAAQCRHVSGGRQNEAVSGIDSSPFVAAQRRKLQGMFGAAVQLYEGDGAAEQFAPVQRVEEEEPLQGRFAIAQLQGTEEEEPLQGKFLTAQLQGTEEEEPLQGKFETIQREDDDEEIAQPKSVSQATTQLQQDPAPKPNNTGLPDNLKTGVESLSGISMDSVRVHYNSSQPTQLNALAYAQGTDIHVAPGQERHLPHEAWHVVQQAQGRVQPTMQLKDGVPVNDDAGLEHEADVMGERANHIVQRQEEIHTGFHGGETIVQRKIDTELTGSWTQVQVIPDNAFQGLPGTASKTVKSITATTSPADPVGMSTWKAKGYLKDPAKTSGQALTRMHAVRGKFGGPSSANNMFLGTAPSNNFNADSHYKQVEKPLEDYVSGSAGRAFDYRVTPNANNIPSYMQTRINNTVEIGDKDNFTSFANAHIPNGFTCEADLYRKDGSDNIWKKAVSQGVSTTVDADEGSEDAD